MGVDQPYDWDSAYLEIQRCAQRIAHLMQVQNVQRPTWEERQVVEICTLRDTAFTKRRALTPKPTT